MKFFVGIVLLALLVVVCCKTLNLDEEKELQQAIEFVHTKMPKLKNDRIGSGSQWKQDFNEAVSHIRSHPKYKKYYDDWETEIRQRETMTAKRVPFFSCSASGPSSTVPTSVHKLRPADVKVIGAIGDSLTAANGALASSVIGLTTENRGYAWSIGGQVDITKHTTLANILKQYNSKVYGHSTGSGNVNSAVSFMNYAEPGKVAEDMPYQARRLVDAMKADNKIDFNNDWKVITVFIGGNDGCDYCKDKSKLSAANYIKHVQEALDIFHKEVPRAYVNVVEVLDITHVKELQTGGFICSLLLGSMLCKCAARPGSDAEFKELQNVIVDYQTRLRNLVASGRYDTRDDFTVVNQPFLRNTSPPKDNKGKIDFSYFSPDCFHFSAKGHDAAGLSLWNNMIEPVGQKSTSWTANGVYKCPSSGRPYFSTSKN